MKDSSGFTLLEMLVIMAIISILATILIPNLLSARNASNNSATQSYLRNAINAAEIARANTLPIPANIDTPCLSNPLNMAVDQGVVACAVRQNALATVGYAVSSSGAWYRFDGRTITQGNGTPTMPTLP